MAWAINNDIRPISDFRGAERLWNVAKPWRNKPSSWRPLANRRMQHKRLVKTEEGYECVLYRTPIVTYGSDGHIRLRCFDSVSSQIFANCVTPRGCNTVSKNGIMLWQVRTDEGERFYREGKEALHLCPTDKENWCLVNEPGQIYEIRNDRKKRAEVRKMVKPFAEWHTLVSRLQGIARPRYMRHVSPATAETIAPLLNDISAYPKILNTVETPEALVEALYYVYGGIYKAPVPHDRLPRNLA
jgi:hypothetical protein